MPFRRRTRAGSMELRGASAGICESCRPGEKRESLRRAQYRSLLIGQPSAHGETPCCLTLPWGCGPAWLGLPVSPAGNTNGLDDVDGNLAKEYEEEDKETEGTVRPAKRDGKASTQLFQEGHWTFLNPRAEFRRAH